MASHGPRSHALQTNMDVDYVISYRFANTSIICLCCIAHAVLLRSDMSQARKLL